MSTRQPNWPAPQPLPPPRRRRGFLSVLAILVCAAAGTILGGMLGSMSVVLGVDISVGPVFMLAGMWIGLALGIWFGVKITSRPRQPIDTAQYPNQIFRRV